jgi:DHA1 family bicyclomycin/chloramphenicol resistance-like MFS transporter
MLNIMNKQPALFTLILLVSFGSVGATLFTPGLPIIAHYFTVSTAQAQLTITLFLVGYAFGQLLYGALSNRFGRKPALYFGISLAILSTLICALAATLHSFALLVIARFFMALGASVGLKMTFTIIGDTYAHNQATKIISYLLLAFAITPGLGVSIGGFLVELINWQSCFYFFAAYGLLLFILCTRLPETSSNRDHSALRLKNILCNYSAQLKNSNLITCACLMGCGTATVYLFAAMAPFIALQILQLTPNQYGLFNLLPPLGMIAGSLLSAHWSQHKPANKVIAAGLSIAFLGVLVMLLAFIMHWLNFATLFLPVAIIYLGFSLVFANATALATSQAKDKANASAMINFINMGTSVLSVLVLGLIPSRSALILPIIYSGLMLIAFSLYARLTTLRARANLVNTAGVIGNKCR